MDALTARAEDPARASRRLAWARVLERVAEIAGTVTGLLSVLLSPAACVTWVFSRTAADPLFRITGPTLAAFGTSVLVRRYARAVRHDAALLADFTLTVNDAGIEWTGANAGSRDWAGLGHIAAMGHPGRRRLMIVDAGQDAPVDQSPMSAFIGRAYHPDRYLLDVPVDSLTVPDDVILNAIRRGSSGRFPDRATATEPKGRAG